MIQVRRIRADEGPSLRAIRLRALSESPTAFSSTLERELGYGDSLWATRAAEASSGTRAATFVADSDGPDWVGLVTVLGVGHEAASGHDAAELVSMWIAPEHRRQGLGHKLVQASLDFARDSHARAVELSVTRANENAIRLYQDIGFALAPTTVLPPDHACSGEIRLRMELL